MATLEELQAQILKMQEEHNSLEEQNNKNIEEIKNLQKRNDDLIKHNNYLFSLVNKEEPTKEEPTKDDVDAEQVLIDELVKKIKND